MQDILTNNDKVIDSRDVLDYIEENKDDCIGRDFELEKFITPKTKWIILN